MLFPEQTMPPGPTARQPYAIRLQEEDWPKGLEVLLDYGSGQWAGARGGLLFVSHYEVEYLDLAGLHFDRLRLDRRYNIQQILDHFTGAAPLPQATPSERPHSKPSLLGSLYTCIKDWYGSR